MTKLTKEEKEKFAQYCEEKRLACDKLLNKMNNQMPAPCFQGSLKRAKEILIAFTIVRDHLLDYPVESLLRAAREEEE